LEINGVYVENLRKKLGLSQDDFTNLLGVSRGTVINYEKGKVIPESKFEILRKLESGMFNIDQSQQRVVDIYDKTKAESNALSVVELLKGKV
jgi:DNA-binding XRE family transcriptional regulator